MKVLAPVVAAGCMAVAAAAGAADASAQYDQYCMACHGPDARGIDNLGVDLLASKFVAAASPGALVEFLRQGRLPDDPASLTGRPMPGFAWVAERIGNPNGHFLSGAG